MQKRKNKQGFALAYGLVIMVAVLIILTSMIGYIVSQLKFSANRAEREEALNVAEAGVFWYRWYLAHELSGKTAEQINDFWQGGGAYGVTDNYKQDYLDYQGHVIGTYEIAVQKPDPGSTIVMVKSTGHTAKMPAVQRTVQVRFRRPSWSEYAVLANDFMRFGEGTEVYGKIHSNKGIRFDGVAHNVVSSLVSTFDDPDHDSKNEFGVHTHVNAPPASGVNDSFRTAEAPPSAVPNRNDVFIAGRQFPVPEVSFTGVLSDLSFMKTKAQSGAGKYFDNSYSGRQIILKADGTFDVYKVSSYSNATNTTNPTNAITSFKGTTKSDGSGSPCDTPAPPDGPNTQCQSRTTGSKCYCQHESYSIPDGGIIFVDNNLWLEGTINTRKVTIVAGGTGSNVFVGNNNILYTNFDGKDVLGIIAQNDVEVVEYSQNNLVLDGAFIAQGGRVGRMHYGDHKNSITINGSMATNLRYGFAYTDNTGYNIRNLNFDNNLLYYPPPYFPTGTQYSIDSWQEL